MSNPDRLPSFGEAIAQIEPTILYEAKRQFELLNQPQRNQMGTVSARTSGRQVHLSLYYRNVFEMATEQLSDDLKIKLLHICFAYKTRARVFSYLEMLDPKKHAWVDELKRVVRERGRDTVFAEVEGVNKPGTRKEHVKRAAGKVINELEPPSDVEKLLTGPFGGWGSLAPPARSTPGGPLRTCFLIPTLSLAFPAQFFQALQCYGPAKRLDVFSLLLHPAAYLLALSPFIKDVIRANLPTFWQDPARRRLSTGTVNTKEAWEAFFEHLLQGAAKLIHLERDEVEL